MRETRTIEEDEYIFEMTKALIASQKIELQQDKIKDNAELILKQASALWEVHFRDFGITNVEFEDNTTDDESGTLKNKHTEDLAKLHFLNMSIGDVGLSYRVWSRINHSSSARLNMHDIVKRSTNDLLLINGIGHKAIEELEVLMAKNGFKIGDDITKYEPYLTR